VRRIITSSIVGKIIAGRIILLYKMIKQTAILMSHNDVITKAKRKYKKSHLFPLNNSLGIRNLFVAQEFIKLMVKSKIDKAERI
jgi:hypothetical protein